MTEIETKKEGRLVDEVLKEIMKVIPESEDKLINALNKFKSNLNYEAPEIRRGPECWIPFIQILNFYIPIKENEWQLKIRDILVV
jgi:hypothetical protein